MGHGGKDAGPTTALSFGTTAQCRNSRPRHARNVATSASSPLRCATRSGSARERCWTGRVESVTSVAGSSAFGTVDGGKDEEATTALVEAAALLRRPFSVGTQASQRTFSCDRARSRARETLGQLPPPARRGSPSRAPQAPCRTGRWIGVAMTSATVTSNRHQPEVLRRRRHFHHSHASSPLAHFLDWRRTAL